VLDCASRRALAWRAFNRLAADRCVEALAVDRILLSIPQFMTKVLAHLANDVGGSSSEPV
jgi:hypothetical protein